MESKNYILNNQLFPLTLKPKNLGFLTSLDSINIKFIHYDIYDHTWPQILVNQVTLYISIYGGTSESLILN